MNAADLAHALAGHRTADGYLCRCPVPSHGQGKGDRRPSLLIKDGDTSILFRCFAGCQVPEILAELRSRGLIEGAERPARSMRREAFSARPHVGPPHEPDPEALAIWQAALPLPDTLGERYLAEHRSQPGPHPVSLRFAAAVAHPVGLHLPALVTAVQAPDWRIVAVQVTYLRASDGAKAPLTMQRKTFGALGAGAVRLAAAGDVLGLAEGTESGLAAQRVAQVPCWAALGAGRMHRVAVPASVRELHTFADDDGPGRAAADRTADVHTRQGRRVVLRHPPKGFKDWAALVQANADWRLTA